VWDGLKTWTEWVIHKEHQSGKFKSPDYLSNLVLDSRIILRWMRGKLSDNVEETHLYQGRTRQRTLIYKEVNSRVV
jgi:hypothetical protein